MLHLCPSSSTSDSGLSGVTLLVLVKHNAAVPACFNHRDRRGSARKLILTEGITLDRPVPWGHFRIFIGLVLSSKQ